MKFYKVLFIYSIPFFLISCVPSELDNIESFEYTFPGLEEIDPLPELVLTAPAEVIQTNGEIIITKEADELVKDVIAAVIDENITAENLIVIDAFSKLTPEISSDLIIETVTDAWISGILNGTVLPSANLKKIADEFKKNPALTKYFSQLVLPAVDGLFIGGRLYLPLDPEGKFTDNEILRALVLIGPCKETAEKVYLGNVKILEDQSEAQLVAIDIFYDNLKKQALDQYTQKFATKNQIVDSNVAILNKFLLDFNQSVDKLDYPEEVKRGLKIYIAAFAIDLRETIVKWGIAYQEASEIARDKRLGLINSEQGLDQASAKANLKSAIDDLKKAFEEAINTCHNQGAGG